MKREINLRGFTMQIRYGGLKRKSGPVLAELMYNGDLDIAMYYLARGKLEAWMSSIVWDGQL